MVLRQQHPPPPPHPPSPPFRPDLGRQSSTASKRSFHSSYSADDERSIVFDIMGPDRERDIPARPPQYDGEDTSLTSRRELWGFYVYGWAAEVFVVCGVGSFIPITLEQLARERGVLQTDGKTPCTTAFDRPQPPSELSGRTPTSDAAQCVVYILGAEVNTASFAMYTFSISVLIQALLIISMSGAADHGRYRKSFLLNFAFIGSIATMLFLPVTPQIFVLGALLAIISNTCFGASFVLLNSFLPLLVRNHPSVVESYPESEDSYDEDEDDYHDRDHSGTEDEEELDYDEMPNQRSALLRRSSTTDYTAPFPKSPATSSHELALSTRISSYGIGIGYTAALLVQAFAIIIVMQVDTTSTNFSLRLVLFCVGAWWFIFTIPAAFWLKSRPGPQLHLDNTGGKFQTGCDYFKYSWRSLGKTVMHARKLKDVLLFLGAWFLLSDAIATVSGTAVLFAKTSLSMKPGEVAFINVVVTITGIIGAFSWSRLSIMMGLKPTQTILFCIALFELIPIYGLIGYIPAIRKLGVFGLQQPWEMYPLGAVYGFVLGGLSSYCRSLFGELIPPGFEAAFYALYAITDKGSSVFGPAVVGAITDATGGIRPAFWFLAVLVGLPFPLMALVDVERGRADGAALASALSESRGKTPERGSPRSSSPESFDEGEAETERLTGEPHR
ncbi:Major facilitator superfamily domain general substrate transporter [Botryosphaeria dothidea]|uniref:Autophagy-related protein n=1 Tax=Botryosphaeria dothidea TaxID=55169 RepID=A0A8H4IT51_9PEZI|nr:Major facilitator superfamily domain general substrate transporter [Botryosphaeria dothidea]